MNRTRLPVPRPRATLDVYEGGMWYGVLPDHWREDEMLRLLLLFALLTPQLRPPSTLRAPATPPAEGTGKFQDHTYAFKSEAHYVVIEYTPMLPAKRTVVLDAMRAACQDLYDLDFSKVKPRPGPAPGEWLFELKDLRICYGRQMPSPVPTGEIKTVRIWMP